MSARTGLVKKHMDALLAEADAAGLSHDVVGRALINQVIELYRQTRSIDDIASELTFLADNLDPDEEYAFMRP